jgi:hypothetical protein
MLPDSVLSKRAIRLDLDAGVAVAEDLVRAIGPL